MSRSIVWALLLALTGSVALATPYWIAYEADGTFPEEEGWTRITHAGGAERYFEEGALVLDGLASIQIVDFYRMYRPGALDPGPGELFIAQWRLQVDEVIGLTDPAIEIVSDEGRGVLFGLSEDGVRSFYEPEVSVPFEPYVYHELEFRSADMLSYELLIDGQFAVAGSFHDSAAVSQVGWGDGAQGAAGFSHWDYSRLGVVPEPTGALLLGCAGLPVIRSISRQRRRSLR